jgi:hypothetical protein
MDGEYRHFSVRAVSVFADDGAIREWAGITPTSPSVN